MLKIGLVGVGSISGAHVPAWEHLKEDGIAELVAICDIRPEQMDKYPEKRHYNTLDEMLEKEELDILDICVPTYAHAELAIKGLEHGVNVLSEKPLSLDPEDAHRVWAAAKKNNVKFMVAQVVRFWREYEILKNYYDTEKYGKLRSLSMWRLSGMPNGAHNWFRDENLSGLTPYDMHVHDLDFCIHAFGEPKKVQQHRTKNPGEDAIQGTYIYDDFYITIETAWYGVPYSFNFGFRAMFDKAILEADKDGNLQIWLEDGLHDLSAKSGVDAGVGNISTTTSAYENEIRHFVECVKTGADPLVREDQVFAVLQLAKSFSNPENNV